MDHEHLNEDQRKFQMWFRINHQSPFRIGNLDIQEYIQLKNSNEAVYDFITNQIEIGEVRNDDTNIKSLSKSIDDVEYDLVFPFDECISDNLSVSSLACQEVSTECNRELDSNDFLDESSHPSSSNNSNPVSDSNYHAPCPVPHTTHTNQTHNPNKPISKQPSLVWNYFQKESRIAARCTICNKIIKNDGNTTNLHQHLKRVHLLSCSTTLQTRDNRKRKISTSSNESVDDPSEKRISKNCSNQKLPRIDEAFQRMNSFRDKGSKAEKITNNILYMIVTDGLALSLVENEGFKSFMKLLAPLYKVPDRTTITRLMDARYEILKDRVKANLQKITSLSATCDIWTDVSKQSYLGVTIHYLEQCRIKSRCLSVFPMSESHDGPYIAESFFKVMESFDINPAKIIAIITDDASNMINAFDDKKRLPCFARAISHIVPEAIRKVTLASDIIDKVKLIFTKVRQGVEASDHLKKLQLFEGKTVLNFIQDLPTRWNSTFQMIERYLLLEDHVLFVKSKLTNPPEIPTPEEIVILKDLVLLMQPFNEVIEEISGDSYPTCSIIIPIIKCLNKRIGDCILSTDVSKEFRRQLLKSMNERFKTVESNLLLSVSTILDPRFKKLHFENYGAGSNAILIINSKIQSSVSSKESNLTSSEVLTNDAENLWSYHDHLVAKSKSVMYTSTDELCTELHQFLDQPLADRRINPLEHWQKLKSSYPYLYEIAMQHFCIVATSVPSERLFSKAGSIKTEKRNRLSGKHLDKLLFLSGLTREEWDID